MKSTVENPQSAIRNPQTRIPLFDDEPQTLAELFRKSVNKYNLPDALNYKKDGKWHKISSVEMLRKAENIALGLYDLGVRKDDKVAILAANSPEWTLSDAGCQLAGIIDAPIYTTLAADSVKYIINDSGAKVFFLEDNKTYERLQEICADCPTIEKYIFFDAT